MERAMRFLAVSVLEGTVLWIHLRFLWVPLSRAENGAWTLLQPLIPAILPVVLTALLRFPDSLWSAIGVAVTQVPLFLVVPALVPDQGFTIGDGLFFYAFILPGIVVLWLPMPLLVRFVRRKEGV
jgi:hypothetical protein